MKCVMCGAQAWCVTSEGDVKERDLCYDCEALCEMVEDDRSEFSDDDNCYMPISDDVVITVNSSEDDEIPF